MALAMPPPSLPGPGVDLGEDRRREAAEALVREHQQDPAEHEGAEDREQRRRRSSERGRPRGGCGARVPMERRVAVVGATRVCRAVSMVGSLTQPCTRDDEEPRERRGRRR